MTSSQTETSLWQDAALVQKAQSIGSKYAEAAINLAQQIANVPAPTGDEHERSLLVANLFRAHGVDSVTTDSLSDIVGRLPGRDQERAVLLAAHIDTVFARETALHIHRDEFKAYGPGVGDNSLGVAAVILLAEMIQELGADLSTDLLLTGNVGEEGLGNLRGVNEVLSAYPEIGAVIAVEGQNLGRITHIAVGSVRMRITVCGPGGHSWGDFGNPSAITAAAKLIGELDRIPLTQSPKTTLNIGTISGGLSINSIAPSVAFDIDLRSTDPNSLNRLVARVLAHLSHHDDRITVEPEELGKRPAGQAPATSRIVTSAAEILRSLSCPPSADASSTDANAAIARGLPAVCVGMTTGGNAHRMDEYIDLAPVGTGLAQLLLLALSVSDDLANGRLTGPT